MKIVLLNMLFREVMGKMKKCEEGEENGRICDWKKECEEERKGRREDQKLNQIENSHTPRHIRFDIARHNGINSNSSRTHFGC